MKIIQYLKSLLKVLPSKTPEATRHRRESSVWRSTPPPLADCTAPSPSTACSWILSPAHPCPSRVGYLPLPSAQEISHFWHSTPGWEGTPVRLPQDIAGNTGGGRVRTCGGGGWHDAGACGRVWDAFASVLFKWRVWGIRPLAKLVQDYARQREGCARLFGGCARVCADAHGCPMMCEGLLGWWRAASAYHGFHMCAAEYGRRRQDLRTGTEGLVGSFHVRTSCSL